MQNDLTHKYVGQVPGVNPNLSFLEHEIGNYNFLCFPGGTRSGKTYSILQWMWYNMERYSGLQYTIVRKTLTALRITALKDFVQIGQDMGLYRLKHHNRSSNVYRHNGNTVLFLGADNEEKMRGAKQHILYMNEAPELSWSVVEQLLFRTEGKVLLDYNPSYTESWVYEKIHTRATSAFITTTYRDNPYLSRTQLDQLDWMRDNDPESYKIYGLGQRGELRGQIFRNWVSVPQLPTDGQAWATVIDWGFSNDVCCIAAFCRKDRTIYARELVYLKGQDNLMIAIHLFHHGVKRNDIIIADCAEPKSGAELRRGWQLTEAGIRDCLQQLMESMDQQAGKGTAKRLGYTAIDIPALQQALSQGYLIRASVKGEDSVRQGIPRIKQFTVALTEDSANAWNEYRLYRWDEDRRTGELLNQPIDKHNHFCDTLRYYVKMTYG